jgi:hypothetical protein
LPASLCAVWAVAVAVTSVHMAATAA